MIKEVFPDSALQAGLNQIGADIKGTIHELRDVLKELRPPALLHFGFSKVLQMSAQDFQERNPEVELELDIAADDSGLPNQTHLALLRIYQAGITNITRYAQASKVWIRYTVDARGFYFELGDNGLGFEPRQDFDQLTREGHFGLVAMKDRAETIGANFTLESQPGKGTRIIVRG
jgi:signal transduction histidine kinase